MTPMMQQYREAKARHPGMLLLFRMGDFYELFDDDAQTAARLLGLTLTSRDKQIPMAGFPHHQLEQYLQKLLHLGHRVAVCEQVEDPSTAKGLVKRDVTRVVTPGTITEDDLLDPRSSNHLVAMHATGLQVGLAWVDLSVGHFHATEVARPQLQDELLRLAPAESICSETTFAQRLTGLGLRLFSSADGQPAQSQHAGTDGWQVTLRPDWTFDPLTSQKTLHEHFGVLTMAGFGFEDGQPGLVAAGALLQYLQETLKAGLVHLHRLQPYRHNQFLLLDEVTRRSLELTMTLREGQREGSLLAAIDRTTTTMGARLLAEWLVSPPAQREAIDARQAAIGELKDELPLRQDLQVELHKTFDLQRLTARVSTGRASPRDLGAIARTLRQLPRLKAKLTCRRSALLCDLEGRLELCADLRQALDAALLDELPLSPREGAIIREGYNTELDELRGIARSGKEWIARFQAEEIARTGINSLKVGFNQVFGYYIEITHAQAAKVPPDYQRKQTLKNAERYITPELKEYEEKVLSAEDKIHDREYELFLALRDQVAAQTTRLMQTAEVLAMLDLLAGLADLATSRQYCRPTMCDEPVLEIDGGRHPVLEQTLPPGTFVPNDISLGPEHGNLWLITGPNMSGKSTFIRQIALITLLAHLGSFVPAARARIGVTDRIFTRVGASDELSRGQSTFMVEMTEAANILNNATPKSLVILDEIGRGTSTYDGVSLAWAITEYLHNAIGCRALFATHYHEIAQLAETLAGLRNHNVLVQEERGTVVFLHKISPGSADKSYGIHVAQLAGVPSEVLDRAKEVLAELEGRHVETKGRTGRRRRGPVDKQRGLFEGMSE
jgi:DNA mismatch repair protein MutS